MLVPSQKASPAVPAGSGPVCRWQSQGNLLFCYILKRVPAKSNHTRVSPKYGFQELHSPGVEHSLALVTGRVGYFSTPLFLSLLATRARHCKHGLWHWTTRPSQFPIWKWAHLKGTLAVWATCAFSTSMNELSGSDLHELPGNFMGKDPWPKNNNV